MRRYDDPVEVRRGMVRQMGAAAGAVALDVMDEGPEQFLWRGRLWQVRSVIAHWVETGAWWQSADAAAVIGSEAATVPAAEVGGTGLNGTGLSGTGSGRSDLLAEREVWRVEARRGPMDAGGVFDLAFCWDTGSWQLIGCQD